MDGPCKLSDPNRCNAALPMQNRQNSQKLKTTTNFQDCKDALPMQNLQKSKIANNFQNINVALPVQNLQQPKIAMPSSPDNEGQPRPRGRGRPPKNIKSPQAQIGHNQPIQAEKSPKIGPNKSYYLSKRPNQRNDPYVEAAIKLQKLENLQKISSRLSQTNNFYEGFKNSYHFQFPPRPNFLNNLSGYNPLTPSTPLTPTTPLTPFAPKTQSLPKSPKIRKISPESPQQIPKPSITPFGKYKQQNYWQPFQNNYVNECTSRLIALSICKKCGVYFNNYQMFLLHSKNCHVNQNPSNHQRGIMLDQTQSELVMKSHQNNRKRKSFDNKENINPEKPRFESRFEWNSYQSGSKYWCKHCKINFDTSEELGMISIIYNFGHHKYFFIYF